MNNTQKESSFIRLPNNLPLEIYRIEETGDSLFDNYQRYDFHQLMWLTEAEGDTRYFLDFNEYELQKEILILIFPGQIDKMDVTGKKGFLFAVENNFFFETASRLNSAYLQGYYGNIFLHTDQRTGETFRTLAGLIREETEQERRTPLLRSYLEAFLALSDALFERSADFPEKADSRIGALMRLIDKHFMEQWETDFYAGLLNLTNKQLNRLVLKGTGRTVKQHLQDRIVLEAKREIRIGERNLKEIAFRLGFSEAAYFSRFFKLQTGMTPTGFREKG